MSRSRPAKGGKGGPGGARSQAAALDPYAQAHARIERAWPVPPRLSAAATALREGKLPLARFELTTHLATHADDAHALRLLARVAVLQDRPDEAVGALQRCLAIDPGFAAARLELARLALQDERNEDALREIESLLRDDADNPLLQQVKANVLERVGDTAGALELCSRLAARYPDHVETAVRLGHARRAAGQAKGGIESYRRAITLRPAAGSAWWALADLKTFRFEPDEIAALRGQLARDGLATADRIPMEYALGKALEDRGDYREAFERYASARAAQRAEGEIDLSPMVEGVRRGRALFTAGFFAERARAGAGHPSADPIFVLGRQRSGSTLVEQILASHPAIEGTAELRYIPAMAASLAGRAGVLYDPAYLGALAGKTAQEITALGQAYLDSTAVHRRMGRPRFIDKKPNNFLHVGLIHLILPNAKIIDARRHPVAACLSSFRSYSRRGGLSLTDLGGFYRFYIELMDHFDAVLPGRIHRVIYEDLVSEPEREIRRLLDYLGLPFEPACLRFHETPRSVLTPSSEQVRRPITTDAVEHWRHFEPWLGPLFDSLGPALAGWRGA